MKNDCKRKCMGINGRICRKQIALFSAGMVVGGILFGGTVAYAEGILAEPGWHRFFVDGQEVQMEAYNIRGNNYVKLRDLGKKTHFNVYWDDEGQCVQIESNTPYTGEAPMSETVSEIPATETESASSATGHKEPTIDEVRAEMAERINAVRRENGVAPLMINDALMEAAQICAEQMNHTHDNEFECLTVIACGYPYGFGANLTVFSGGTPTYISQRAVANWVSSHGHFQTMIKSTGTSIGVGVYQHDGMTYCYMLVGNPAAHNPYE